MSQAGDLKINGLFPMHQNDVLQKLRIDDDGTIEHNGSYYIPVYYPDGTNPKNPVLFIRADHINSISSRLDHAAQQEPL